MAACASCGELNPPSANFCSACGAALLRAAPAPPSARKTVTVLFCDVADSTRLGEALDPETLRRVMSTWFEAMREVLEAHGGTVEKFVGDAVMAVFGVPALHEDDALRAARAAVEMREAVAALNERLGTELAIRIGVNTGEVIAGDPSTGQTFVTGDAVNIAKRLEQAAASGEILLGGSTRRLVANAVVLAPRPAVAAKGKTEALEAWTLVETIPDAPAFARRLDVRLVGRAEELRRLELELAAAREERACRTVTVLGPAGIGKSRLAAELAARAAGATVLKARCLPYGNGITFWPLVQIVRSAGGIQALEQVLAGEPDGDLVLHRVRAAIEPTGDAVSTEELFWGVRRALEALARERPVVLCLEDVHWAEPTFLDLVEYVAGWSRDAAVLLLCLSRPELLDERPAWNGLGTALTLSPLSEAEADALLDELTVEWPLPDEARARVREAAEGNPLFVEQMVAMLAEAGADADAVAIPPTIHALLAARLDRLEPAERAVLERAAVLGKDFTRGGVGALSPEGERDRVGTLLRSLTRKELVRPEATTLRGDDGFRFRHVLIRDAAYGGIPKERRATLHEAAARWQAEHEADDEFVGFHLEQAFGYRAELGHRDAGLAARAAARLTRAGHHAFLRDDMPAAAALLDRAAALAGLDPEVQRERAAALWSTGESERADDALAEAIGAARSAGDRASEWLAVLERAAHGAVADPDAALGELHQVAKQAAAVFDELDHDGGRARAWRTVSSVNRLRCRFAAAEHASELALGYARRAGAAREEAWLVDELCTSLLYGPTPVEQAIRRCEELLEAASGRRLMEANVLCSLAGLWSLRDDGERAGELIARARSLYVELGLRLALAGLTQVSGAIRLAGGDPVAAERELREGYELLGSLGARGLQASYLAHALLVQGRLDDASVLVDEARMRSGGYDVAPQIIWRTAAALLASARAEHEPAVALAGEAVRIAEETDALTMAADAHLVATDVMRAAGRPAEAIEAAALARELYEQKGHVPGARAAEARVAAPAH